jgi:hypothetical protein
MDLYYYIASVGSGLALFEEGENIIMILLC